MARERIIISYDPEGKGSQVNYGWNPRCNVVYSDDFFKTTKMVMKGGNKFLLSKNYFLIAKLERADTQEVSLWVANPY